jgi:hypothetical protein
MRRREVITLLGAADDDLASGDAMASWRSKTNQFAAIPLK